MTAGAAGGLLYLRRRGAGRTLAKLWRMYLFGEQRWYVTSLDLARPVPHDPAQAAALDVRLATEDDVPELAALGRQAAATLHRWIWRGYHLFVVRAGGRVVAFRCLSPHVHPWLAAYFRLAPEQLYSMDFFIAPAFRRQGLSRTIFALTNVAVLAKGFREVLSIQRMDNEDSIIAFRERLTRLGTLTMHRRLWRVRFTFEPAPKPAPPS